MRVIITGALGHIGSAFIRDQTLLSAVDEIVLVDNLSTQRYTSVFGLEQSRYHLIEGSLKQVLDDSLVRECDAVVHLAAMADPGLSFLRPDEVFEENLGGTRFVIEACQRNEVPIVFPSSTSVYGVDAAEIDEQVHGLNPLTPYAQCKLAEEEALQEAFRGGMQGTILRFGTIFGPSPGMRFHTAVNRFCWQAATGRPLTVFRTALRQRRPYLDVRDAAAALARTVVTGTWTGTPLNVSSVNATVSDILQSIRSVIPTAVVDEIDSPAMTDFSFGVSTERARDLGYEFAGDLDTGVRATLELLSGVTKS